MTTYSVKCYENQNTRDCFTYGYTQGDPLKLVATLAIEAANEHDAAETAFAIGNGFGPDTYAPWPYDAGFRSMSKGDVLEIGDEVRLSCASYGWDAIDSQSHS